MDCGLLILKNRLPSPESSRASRSSRLDPYPDQKSKINNHQSSSKSPSRRTQRIQRTVHPQPVRSHRHMQVDLRRRDILVSKKLLDGSQIRPAFQQVRRHVKPPVTWFPLFNRVRQSLLRDRAPDPHPESAAAQAPKGAAPPHTLLILLTIDDFRMLIFDFGRY